MHISPHVMHPNTLYNNIVYWMACYTGKPTFSFQYLIMKVYNKALWSTKYSS